MKYAVLTASRIIHAYYDYLYGAYGEIVINKVNDVNGPVKLTISDPDILRELDQREPQNMYPPLEDITIFDTVEEAQVHSKKLRNRLILK